MFFKLVHKLPRFFVIMTRKCIKSEESESLIIFQGRYPHAMFVNTYHNHIHSTLDIFFGQITTFIKVHVAFVFGLQTL